MFNAIEEVKRQYTYAVQPVKLFETRNSQAAQKSSFDFIICIDFSPTAFAAFFKSSSFSTGTINT